MLIFLRKKDLNTLGISEVEIKNQFMLKYLESTYSAHSFNRTIEYFSISTILCYKLDGQINYITNILE